mgnify:CR=1 FL=1
MELLRKLNYIFARRQKIQLLVLSVIIICGALWELLGITAILPFVNVAMKPHSILENEYMSYFYNLLG